MPYHWCISAILCLPLPLMGPLPEKWVSSHLRCCIWKSWRSNLVISHRKNYSYMKRSLEMFYLFQTFLKAPICGAPPRSWIVVRSKVLRPHHRRRHRSSIPPRPARASTTAPLSTKTKRRRWLREKLVLSILLQPPRWEYNNKRFK